MNATERLVLEELKEMKEFQFATGMSNPIWVLLVPLVCGIFASQILWMIYVLWLERPIVVNRKHMKEEEEAETGGDAEATKGEGVKVDELETLGTKEGKELKEDGENGSGGEQKASPTPLHYKVQPSVIATSILSPPLQKTQFNCANPSVGEPSEQRQHKRSRIIFTTANRNKKMSIK